MAGNPITSSPSSCPSSLSVSPSAVLVTVGAARAAASQRLRNSVSFAGSARDKSCRVKELWTVQSSHPAIVWKGKHLQTITNSPFVAAQHQRFDNWDSADITVSPTYDLLCGQPVESSAFVNPLQTRDF
jgi:hypothetical protein